MTASRRTLLALIPVAALLTACGNTDEPGPQAGSIPTPEASGGAGPGVGHPQVAVPALKTMTTWYTATDRTQTAADKRAASRYFTPELAAEITEPARNSANGEWLAHPESVSVPSVEPLVGTDDVATSVDAYQVTWAWKAPDGTLTPAETVRNYYLTYQHTKAGWRISAYEYQEFEQ